MSRNKAVIVTPQAAKNIAIKIAEYKDAVTRKVYRRRKDRCEETPDQNASAAARVCFD